MRTSLVTNSLQESELYLGAFEDAAALVDIPGISALENFIREPLDIVEPDFAYTTQEKTYATGPPLQIQSVASLDSATSVSGQECIKVPVETDTEAPPVSLLPATNASSNDRSSTPDVFEMAADLAAASTPQSTESLKPPQDASEPESAKPVPAPRPRERKRRQQGTFTVSKLAKQREKNRRCQRSFRERQKVKQEALLQELQDLKDRCVWLEAQLALQQAAARR